MTEDEYKESLRLKQEMCKIETMLRLFDPIDNRYRFRSLFFAKPKNVKVKWGHSYGTDNFTYELEKEDTVAIIDYFTSKLNRLQKEFEEL